MWKTCHPCWTNNMQSLLGCYKLVEVCYFAILLFFSFYFLDELDFLHCSSLPIYIATVQSVKNWINELSSFLSEASFAFPAILQYYYLSITLALCFSNNKKMYLKVYQKRKLFKELIYLRYNYNNGQSFLESVPNKLLSTKRVVKWLFLIINIALEVTIVTLVQVLSLIVNGKKFDEKCYNSC